MSVQDEARSFRSKVDAIRFILRNVLSRHAFKLYLEKNTGVEYLLCYIDLEEIKSLGNDTMIALTTYMLSKYKTMNEASENSKDPKAIISQIIWEKLRRLRDVDLQQTPYQKLISVIINVQNQVLTELTEEFQGFLKSNDYKEWKEHQMKLEKEKSKLPSHLITTTITTATTSGAGGVGTNKTTIGAGTSNNNKTDVSELSRSFTLQKKMLQQQLPPKKSFLTTKLGVVTGGGGGMIENITSEVAVLDDSDLNNLHSISPIVP